MTESMKASLFLDERLTRRGKHDSRSSERERNDAGLDRADAHGLGRLVAASATIGVPAFRPVSTAAASPTTP